MGRAFTRWANRWAWSHFTYGGLELMTLCPSTSRSPRIAAIPLRCLTYPLQRTVHAILPARCPGRVLLARIPFGQAPFLRPLRGPRTTGRRGRRCSLGCVRRFRLRARVGFTIAAPPAAAPVLVRGFPRYYGPVRLPSSVHRRRTSLDFPTRPAAPSATGEAGISRLPRKVFPYVPGVCDRAGSRGALRYRRPECGLPRPPTASAPRSNLLSRLDTRPARTPVNASPPPSRATAHDSGPPWVATTTLPVFAGAQEVKMILKEP